ncbi:hypothetical protein [Tunturibacter empetritectus]|uniref:Uncharacterized protein n=1 Tax=Tunturiibacter lichenicola TaxID=2051959 RepID=A0A7W8N2D1_9BACT|nr:hypothetical protein [Edaphobacter lichenicola]MBB5342273.1 hypothetical protein [Edaphobacter lichenicola]
MPRITKWTTQLLVEKGNRHGLCGVHPDWGMHPSWIAGIEGLDAYNRWVCEVLMPIAFQWIEENYTAVYASVPDDYKDDVGVVIASAFELVKAMSNYSDGEDKAKEFDAAHEGGNVDLTKLNPVWTDIVKQVRNDTKTEYDKYKSVLKDTID